MSQGLSESNLQYIFFEYGTVTDVDGNEYTTLVYGDNEWMIENLRTDVGDYNGENQETHDDDSDFPFTMAAHTISKSYAIVAKILFSH